MLIFANYNEFESTIYMKLTGPKIIVLSQFLFDEEMSKLGLNDDNVERSRDAFISIIGTPECLEYYLDESDTVHYFKNEHSNVLNLEFDDIAQDVKFNGHHFKTMRMNQAEKAVNFIERQLKNNVDTFYIHCRAGMSRSRGFGEFIFRVCQDEGYEPIYEDREIYVNNLNYGILERLNHAYFKKHKLMGYDEGSEYPDEFINIPIKIINRKKYGRDEEF